MDIRDLYYFQVIAECGHMGLAADRLFLTQPALTKAVRRLEESIGAKLFLRKGRRLVLTELGKLLLDKAHRVRQMMDDTKREVKGFAEGLSGHIRLGCAPTMTKFLLPDVIPSLLQHAPGVTIDLHTGTSGQLMERLKDGLLDLALTHVSGSVAGYEVVPLVNDEIVVVAGKNHPIFSRAYTIRDLGNYGWIMPKASAARAWLDIVMARHGCPMPQVRMEASSILYLPRLIASMDLLSLLSRRNLVRGEGKSLLREVALPETKLHRVFCLVYAKSAYLSPAVQRLVTLLHGHADAAPIA